MDWMDKGALPMLHGGVELDTGPGGKWFGNEDFYVERGKSERKDVKFVFRVCS